MRYVELSGKSLQVFVGETGYRVYVAFHVPVDVCNTVSGVFVEQFQLAAKALYTTLAEKLCPTVTDSMTVAQVLAFIIIWIAVPLIFLLVASLLTKAMKAVSLDWLNRWLGCVLGALKFLLLTSLVICLIEFMDGDNKLISPTKKSESLLYYPIETFAGIFFPAAKSMTQQYILENKDATRRTQ